MKPSESNPVIPRRLAIGLLHAAQCATGTSCAALVTAPANGGLPDTFAAFDGEMAPLPAAGRRAWAVFRFQPDGRGPDVAAFAGDDTALRLSASLEIKGVLQLHAWRLDGDHVAEVGLRIVD